jgi:hypothetical protein
MSASTMAHRVTRRAILKAGALTVGFACASIPRSALSQDTRLLDPKNVFPFSL